MINFYLFRALKSVFDEVKVSNEGQKVEVCGNKLIGWGECYRVCCPYCLKYGYKDKNFHFYISHVFGMTLFDRKLLSLLKCHRHDCLKDEENYLNFLTLLNGYLKVVDSMQLSDLYEDDLFLFSSVEEPEEKFIEEAVNQHFPQTDVLLEYEDSAAFKYIRQKTENNLEQAVKIISKHKLQIVINSQRIFEWGGVFIPVFHPHCDKIFSYQVRCFSDLKTKFSSGKHIHKTLYNVNNIPKNCDNLVVVEGPGDVWKLDSYDVNVVGLFGHYISPYQAKIFNLIRPKKISLLLDVDVKENEKNRNLTTIKHNLEYAPEIVILNITNNNGKTDPADLSKEEVLRILE